jgi:peroxiredoxin
MRSRLSFLTLPALPLAVLGLALAGGCRAGAPPPARAAGAVGVVGAVGAAGDYHAITVTGADGREARLSDVLGRRAALVSFWAPWCEPCVRELPELERLARAVAPCQATVLGVAVGERPETIADFSRARRLSYPQYTDESFTLADALGQRRIPATVVFDDDQRIVFVGQTLDARATAALARVLGDADAATRCPLP